MTMMTSRVRWTSRAVALPVKKRNERTQTDLTRCRMVITKKKIATWFLEGVICLAMVGAIIATAWMAVEALGAANVF